MTAPTETPCVAHSCTFELARKENARQDALRSAERYATDNATLRDRIVELEQDVHRLRGLLEQRQLDPDEQPARTAAPWLPAMSARAAAWAAAWGGGAR